MRPYTIPHDQEGAGLRSYLPIGDPAPRPRRRWMPIVLAFLAGVLIGARAFASAPSPITFIQPRVPIVLAPPTGTVIPVQLRIDPHRDNRSYAITWCDGSSGHTLDGVDDAAIQPPMAPLNVRVAPGECEFVGAVFGAGGKLRARTSFVMHVCGGQDEGCGGVIR